MRKVVPVISALLLCMGLTGCLVAAAGAGAGGGYIYKDEQDKGNVPGR
jgi:hypothetical protein